MNYHDNMYFSAMRNAYVKSDGQTCDCRACRYDADERARAWLVLETKGADSLQEAIRLVRAEEQSIWETSRNLRNTT